MQVLELSRLACLNIARDGAIGSGRQAFPAIYDPMVVRPQLSTSSLQDASEAVRAQVWPAVCVKEYTPFLLM